MINISIGEKTCFIPWKKRGVLEAVMVHFKKKRLPRVLDMKKMVDNGETLNELDIAFLEEVFSDTSQYKDSALLIDESGFTKKGHGSVGVARQYNGRLGKTESSKYCIEMYGCGMAKRRRRATGA